MEIFLNLLTPNDLQRRRAVRPLKIQIYSEKSTQASLRAEIWFWRLSANQLRKIFFFNLPLCYFKVYYVYIV
jgi:hypothetical protein